MARQLQDLTGLASDVLYHKEQLDRFWSLMIGSRWLDEKDCSRSKEPIQSTTSRDVVDYRPQPLFQGWGVFAGECIGIKLKDLILFGVTF